MQPRILVVGDVMIDRTIHGRATRVNPEAPGVVVEVDRVEDRPGGAAAVAWLCEGLGEPSLLFGAWGQIPPHVAPPDAEWFAGHPRWRLTSEPGRSLTIKQRVRCGDSQLADRCDWDCRRPIQSETADRLLASLRAAAPSAAAVLVSDYDKGVVTPRLWAGLVDATTESRLPLLVDPARGRPWHAYAGASFLKANAEEARAAGYEGLAGAWEAADTLGCAVLVTRGPAPAILAQPGGEPREVACGATTPRDVCGAGDTVLAALGVGLARGLPLPVAVRAALACGTAQVGRAGIEPVAWPARLFIAGRVAT